MAHLTVDFTIDICCLAHDTSGLGGGELQTGTMQVYFWFFSSAHGEILCLCYPAGPHFLMTVALNLVVYFPCCECCCLFVFSMCFPDKYYAPPDLFY